MRSFSSEKNVQLGAHCQRAETDASAWLARLSGEQLVEDDGHAFEAWLAADPEHRAAYERALSADPGNRKAKSGIARITAKLQAEANRP